MKKPGLSLILMFASILACARSTPPPEPAAPSIPIDSTRTLVHDEIERNYILHVPTSADPSSPVPLVLVLHGGGGNADNAIRMSGFNAIADEEGFVVAYPNGTGRLEDKVLTWNGGTCCGYAYESGVDDVGFVRAVIADIQSLVAIDAHRIYATGMSNGAIMSYRLACEASDLFAAIGPVSGTQNVSICEPLSPVSVIHFHGTDDQHLPYAGGVGPESLTGVDYASVQESVGFWVAIDRCISQPQQSRFDDVQLQAWEGCEGNSSVTLYTISGGQHAWPGSNGPGWPGGDEPAQSISATRLMWEFFATHPKP